MNRTNTSRIQNESAKLTTELFSLKYLLSWFGVLVLRLSTLLPYNFLMTIGNITGNIIHKVSPHRAEIVKINLEKCLGVKGDELEELVKLNFHALGRGLFEMAYAWWASDYKIKNLKHRIVNQEALKNIDSGALVLIKHSTHLELDLRILSNYFDLTGMYKNQTNKVINYVMINSRNKYIKASASNHEAIKAIRWVKEGKKFLYAADQDYGQKVSLMIPFFSSPAATVTFPFLFSKKKYKIIMADVSKIEEIYEVELINIENTNDEEKFLSQMNKVYEDCIRKEPEGYLWMHRRFKSGSKDSIYPVWSSREKRRAKRRAKRT